ncbi:hypothetical protein BGW38_009166 [Lunasporangiospora selenospora]|uniref:Uncharacterized protein n=1 Tax=Lunasporangiospora selenospora TaxID=979761 RepID=A0A9P6FXC4_9FUNG|nr:hypothetical protein BGW38_009166 [Lunasporangiospora selenospora]
MSSVRRSSRTKTTAASKTETTPTTLQSDSAMAAPAPEDPTVASTVLTGDDVDTPSSTAATIGSDSTHQAHEHLGTKKDQQSEASSDPDAVTTATEKVDDEVSTETPSEAQETPVSVATTDKTTEDEVEQVKEPAAGLDLPPLHTDGAHAEPPASLTSEGAEALQSHGLGHEHEQANAPETTTSETVELPTKIHHHIGKRTVDELDSNTVGDSEAQDYLAGAYKSPYRHTHKAEKVGREER